MAKIIILLSLIAALACTSAQRITTIHLDGVQYFISRMNPYSPELNYFLAYQYCRSLGLQLASFETKEKAESMTTYLKNAGYGNYDFWTSGNRLGTGMFLWMSTGLPFNATFDFFENSADAIQAGLLDPIDHNSNTSPQRTARDSSSGAEKGCVILKQPTLKWMPEDCSAVKDFICEQTRCYYYNYGSIPVSSAQGRPITSTTPLPVTNKSPISLLSSTTPLPVIMSTYASFSKNSAQESGEQQPSFVSLKFDHERALDTDDEAEAEDEEVMEGEEHHDDSDDDMEEHNESFEEHARELNDAKEQANSLVDSEQSIEKLHQHLQIMQHTSDNTDSVAATSNDDADDDHDAAPNSHEQESAHLSLEQNNKIYDSHSLKKLNAADNVDSMLPTSTELPAVEVRLKQISQEIEKLTNSGENQQHNSLHKPAIDSMSINHDSDIGRQSFLSLTDLIRTLRPNDKQIIPQIDSDYSNAMRVLGETSAVMNNNGEMRKFKDMDRVSY